MKFLPYYRGGLFTVSGKVDDAGSERALAMVVDAKTRLGEAELEPEQRRLLELVADGVVERYA